MLCDGVGHPLHFELTPGQTHEAAAFDTGMIGADEQLRDDKGQPMARPLALAGDKATARIGSMSTCWSWGSHR